MVAYNKVAKKIMEENGIQIDDLYAFTLPKVKEVQIPDNVHFTKDGYGVLAGQVAGSIEKALASRKK